MSVPNQKVLTIKKGNPVPPFTQVSKYDWVEASKTLSYTAFQLFLYLATNSDGFRFELSPKAIVNEGLMSRASYYRAVTELENNGYLEDNCFYTQSRRLREQLETL